jgi:hypothetical protein
MEQFWPSGPHFLNALLHREFRMTRFPTHHVSVEVDLNAGSSKEAEEMVKKMFCSPFRNCIITEVHTIVEETVT